MILSCLFALVNLMLGSVYASSTINWLSSYQEALELSAKENKEILLFFTGSDWSGWGMKMKQEILDSSEFSNVAGAHFICVLIDDPLYKTLPEEEMKQNRMLKERMEITEYPRLVILNAKEQEIARLGYSPEDGKKFGEDLLQIVQKDHDLNAILSNLKCVKHKSSELIDFYKLAIELKRYSDVEQLLDLGLKSEEPLFFLLEKYRLLVEAGKGEEAEALCYRKRLLELDPTNEKGVQFSLAIIAFQDRSSRKGIFSNPKEVIQPLESYLEHFGSKDLDNLWRIEMMLAEFYLDCDENKIALEHAESAYQAAPLERKEEIRGSLEYIRGQVS